MGHRKGRGGYWWNQSSPSFCRVIPVSINSTQNLQKVPRRCILHATKLYRDCAHNRAHGKKITSQKANKSQLSVNLGWVVSKSHGAHTQCRFDSPLRHHTNRIRVIRTRVFETVNGGREVDNRNPVRVNQDLLDDSIQKSHCIINPSAVNGGADHF